MPFFDTEKEAYILDPNNNTVKEIQAYTSDSLTGIKRRVKLGKSGLIELASKYLEDNKVFSESAVTLGNVLGAASPYNFAFALSLGRIMGLNNTILELIQYDISPEEVNEIKARHDELQADLAKDAAKRLEDQAKKLRDQGGDPLEGDA